MLLFMTLSYQVFSLHSAHIRDGAVPQGPGPHRARDRACQVQHCAARQDLLHHVPARAGRADEGRQPETKSVILCGIETQACITHTTLGTAHSSF